MKISVILTFLPMPMWYFQNFKIFQSDEYENGVSILFNLCFLTASKAAYHIWVSFSVICLFVSVAHLFH